MDLGLSGRPPRSYKIGVLGILGKLGRETAFLVEIPFQDSLSDLDVCHFGPPGERGTV